MQMTWKFMKKLKYLLFMIALLGTAGWGPFAFFFTSPNKEPMGTQAWIQREIELINLQADNINQDVLKLSLNAYLKARHNGLGHKPLLTIIDYSKPSTERRLWVVDIKSGKVLFNTYVSHGKNSGKLNATSFSNEPGSLKSSIGMFLTTAEPYVGSNGYSLRLIGLEHGINDNAYRRAIVVHGAWYVDPNVIKKYGQLGRSWGCPAVSEHLARPLIDTIKEHTLIFVYSRVDRRWLHHSTFLAG